jgi:hypothetical protein
MQADAYREDAFQLFALFAGDCERTAHALGVRPVDVLRMAEAEGWLDKLAPILALKKSTRPGDLERGLNRAMNFIQAHRMRLFVSRVLNRLAGMNAEEFEAYLMTHAGTKGEVTKKLSTRAIADLASALEKCQSMTYLALSDTAQDRSKRDEADDGEVAALDIHARIAKAMAEVKDSSTPRALLFDEQLSTAQATVITPEPSKPEPKPYDKD